MRKNKLKIAIVSFAILITLSSTAHSSDEEKVWFWFQSCSGKSMTLEVLFDGNEVFKATFPICMRYRSEANDFKKESLKFSFIPNHKISWEGYLDDNYTTEAGQIFEGNIWLAGSEKTALILGVSFISGKQIYMNTLHLALIDEKNMSEVASGLWVSTSPITK